MSATRTKTRNQYRRGNVGDTRDVEITGFADLTNIVTVTVAATQGDTTAPLTAAVLDAAASTVRVQLGTWLETAAVGYWYLVYTLTDGAGNVTRCPDAPDADRIEVTA